MFAELSFRRRIFVVPVSNSEPTISRGAAILLTSMIGHFAIFDSQPALTLPSDNPRMRAGFFRLKRHIRVPFGTLVPVTHWLSANHHGGDFMGSPFPKLASGREEAHTD